MQDLAPGHEHLGASPKTPVDDDVFMANFAPCQRNSAKSPRNSGRWWRPCSRPNLPSPTGGRPRVPDKAILAGVLYKLRTGCQWKALPRQFGSGSTCHRRFSEWVESGVFPEIMGAVLKFYDRKCGIACG